MIELINVPETFLNNMLRERAITTNGLRKFQKIEKILDLEEPEEKIEKEAAEHLYSGYGPIELLFFAPRPDEVLSEEVLKKKVIDTFKLGKFDDLIQIGRNGDTNQGNDSDDDFFQVKVRKIMKMKSLKSKTYEKFLIQLTFLGRHSIAIDKDGQLVELRRTKVVNYVLEHQRGLLQVRTDCSSTKKCMSVFEKLFSDYDFYKINFDIDWIDRIKRYGRLTGTSYECKLTRKHIPSAKKTKALSIEMERYKFEFYRKGESVRIHPEIKKRLEAYDIESDFFSFKYNDHGEKESEYKLQLSINTTPIYFRNSVTESVINYVIDTIFEVFGIIKDNLDKYPDKYVKIENINHSERKTA